MDKGVEVFIPVFNGMDTLKDCISGLLNQSIKPKKIIVADSGSTDGSVEYLKSIPEVQLLQIQKGSFNHGETRNLGWQNCKSEFIFYTVQDAIPTTNTLFEILLSNFSNEKIAGVSGQQIVRSESRNNPIQWYRPYSLPTREIKSVVSKEHFDQLSPLEKDKLTSWDDVIAMYRSEVLKEIPFRRTYYGEDKLWAMDALRSGYTLMIDTNASVYHYHHYNYHQAYNRNFVSTYLKYKSVGVIQDVPAKTDFKIKLKWLKLLFKSKGIRISEYQKWLKYNQILNQATHDARRDFNQALSNETLLESLYLKCVGIDSNSINKIS